MKKFLLIIIAVFFNIGVFAQTPVSVFNYPGLNGSPGSCSNENENLIEIIGALSDYTVDGSIVSFANSATLASQLDACTFFFMTDMESQNPSDNSFFPVASAAVIKDWVNGGGVMVMTATYGSYDNDFLNKIFSWDLTTANGSSWAKNTTNTAGTPFDDVDAATLPNLSATDAIAKNSVSNFTTMWGTDDNATVAVIEYGSGYVIYMGFDFYNTGIGCPANSSDWVQQIIPAALEYATNLSSSSVDNITYTSAQYSYTFSQTGTTYSIMVAAGSTAPANTQIEAGVDYSGVTIVKKESKSTTANIESVFTYTGLTQNTNYDIYAVTKYNDGTNDVFSSIEKVSFSTLAYSLPTVTTASASAITSTSATSGGNVTGDGGATVTARGVCWNTSTNPTTANSKTTESGTTGSFTSSLTLLLPGTTYYVRAYATNSVGTSYGSVVSFTTNAVLISIENGGGTICVGGSAYHVAEELALIGTNYDGARVSISGNFVQGQDLLGINGVSSGIDGSISYSYNASTGILTLSGSANAAAYQTTLRKVTYRNSSASPTTTSRTINFTLGTALPFVGTGHYYEFVTSPAISWTAAKSAAEALNYFGLQGYLVTVTSAEENAFCTSKLSGQGWIGANDIDTEGTWIWATGPETGTQFWSGLSNGSSVGGRYENWAAGEPNNASNEDYAHFLANGEWNDYPLSLGSISGYVVEYGGMAGDPSVTTSDDVTVNFYDAFTTGSITTTGQTICYNGDPLEIGSSVLASGGNGSISYKWQSSTTSSSAGFSDIATSNAATYNPPTGLTDTTWYRRQAKDETCNTTFTSSTGVWKVTVYPEFIIGSISSDQIICNNTAPNELVGIAPTGGNGSYSYQWQSSTDNSIFTNISGATGLNYQPGTLTNTTYYQLIQSSTSGCGSLTTNKVTISVFKIGSISESQVLYYQTRPEKFIGIAPTGGSTPYIYQWQKSYDNVNFANITGATSLDYHAGGEPKTSYFRLLQSSASGCANKITNTLTMMVFPKFEVGTISDNQQIIFNTIPEKIIGTSPRGGMTPYTYQWQSSADNLTFTDITGATSIDLQPEALTETTYYRLIQSSANNYADDTTNTVTITVYPKFRVGSIEESQSICFNTVPSEIIGIAPTGGDMSYTYQWQSSTDNVIFTDIAGATGLNYQPDALTVTTYYRCIQTSAFGNGEGTTNKITVTVYPAFFVGSISTDQSICYNTTPNELIGIAPTGGNGSYTYQWQSSADNVMFTDITGATSLNYQTRALTATTYYQLVQSTTIGCDELITNKVIITVYPEFIVGSIAENQSICYNTVPNELIGIAPTGGNGIYTYQWQSSMDNSSFTDISGATSLNYQPGALATTTYYRLIQAPTSGCGGLATHEVTITVLPKFTVGLISGNQSICYNTTPNELIGIAPTGANGDYSYQWQSSTDNNNFSDISDATGLNYQPEALTSTTYYQLVQSSAAPCGDVLITNKVIITVYDEFIVGSISGNQSICYNTAPDELIGVAPTGGNGTYMYQWQSSEDNSTFTNISGATGLHYQPDALTSAGYYQLIQASDCGVLTTNKVTVTVYPMVVSPVIEEKKIAGNISILMVDNSQNLYYDYLWTYSDGSALPFDLVADKQFLALPVQHMNASYMVTVFDENACGGASIVKTVTSALMSSAVYPTVSDGNFKLDLSGPETGRIQVRIFNEMGNLFKTLQFEKVSNTESIPILINELKDGTYMIEVLINNFKDIHRVFIR